MVALFCLAQLATWAGYAYVRKNGENRRFSARQGNPFTVTTYLLLSLISEHSEIAYLPA